SPPPKNPHTLLFEDQVVDLPDIEPQAAILRIDAEEAGSPEPCCNRGRFDRIRSLLEEPMQLRLPRLEPRLRSELGDVRRESLVGHAPSDEHHWRRGISRARP